MLSGGERLWVSWDNNEDGHVSRVVCAASKGKRKPTVRKTMGARRWMEMGVEPQSHALTDCCKVKMLLCAHTALSIHVGFVLNGCFPHLFWYTEV